MEVIGFKSALVTPTEDGSVVIALFNGPVTNSSCVALLSCTKETAETLTQSLCSVLKTE